MVFHVRYEVGSIRYLEACHVLLSSMLSGQYCTVLHVLAVAQHDGRAQVIVVHADLSKCIGWTAVMMLYIMFYCPRCARSTFCREGNGDNYWYILLGVALADGGLRDLPVPLVSIVGLGNNEKNNPRLCCCGKRFTGVTRFHPPVPSAPLACAALGRSGKTAMSFTF